MCTKKLLPFIVVALVSCSIAQAGPFGSWAACGVVVNKTFRPTPLSHSLGVDGIYRLELRGQDKKVRRQMVTREVFLAYNVGDEFDEHATPGTPKEAVVAIAKVEAKPMTESLADVMATQIESNNRMVSTNFPPEMLPETEGF